MASGVFPGVDARGVAIMGKSASARRTVPEGGTGNDREAGECSRECVHARKEAYHSVSVVAPVVGVIAPCRGATKAKARDKTKQQINTFQSVERWIWDTGSAVDICGSEHSPKRNAELVYPPEDVVFHIVENSFRSRRLFRPTYWSPLPRCCQWVRGA